MSPRLELAAAEIRAKNEKLQKHGTISRYQRGCRCGPCKKANLRHCYRYQATLRMLLGIRKLANLTVGIEMDEISRYYHSQMVPARFPAIYERVAPFRTVDEIETELNRRCGYPPENVTPPVRAVDPHEARAGTVWEQRSILNAHRALTIARQSTKGTRKKNAGQLSRPLVRK